ncbi:hypothetical protein BY458DRAFT_502019 [Sporodiniella umbellata]|nr:hypothetical protein BY458DRAFT_502019 [Sporodiniella umbellata]
MRSDCPSYKYYGRGNITQWLPYEDATFGFVYIRLSIFYFEQMDGQLQFKKFCLL